jgi:hypothetical protein
LVLFLSCVNVLSYIAHHQCDRVAIPAMSASFLKERVDCFVACRTLNRESKKKRAPESKWKTTFGVLRFLGELFGRGFVSRTIVAAVAYIKIGCWLGNAQRA